MQISSSYVRHVPKRHFNLISIGKLVDNDYHNHLGVKKWKLSNGSLILTSRKMGNTLYKIDARLIKEDVNVVDSEISTELWNKRYGHMSKKGLQILAKNQLLSNVKGPPLMPCIHCLVGKQRRVSFHK